jgi:hypothetical protein
VTSVRDRRPACGFCDGTGLWADPGGDASDADPCPLCEGSGEAPGAKAAVRDDASPTDVAPLGRLLAILPRLTQAERQRLYEDLHALYDCRIYRR